MVSWRFAKGDDIYKYDQKNSFGTLEALNSGVAFPNSMIRSFASVPCDSRRLPAIPNKNNAHMPINITFISNRFKFFAAIKRIKKALVRLSSIIDLLKRIIA